MLSVRSTAKVAWLETAKLEAIRRNEKNKAKRTLKTFEVMVIHLLTVNLCTQKGNPKGADPVQQK